MPEVAALMRLVPYEGDVEVHVENMAGNELARRSDFSKIYVWDLGDARQIWVLSKAALQNTRCLEWRDVPQEEYELGSRPAGAVLMTVGDGWHGMDWSNYRTLLRHPVLGEYAVVRTRGSMREIRSDQNLVIRSWNMSLVRLRNRQKR